jgi:LL-diaminopimelate aminotransferase
MALVEHLLDKAGIVCTPGVGFGDNGEGFVRFALTQTEDRIMEALGRIERI